MTSYLRNFFGHSSSSHRSTSTPSTATPATGVSYVYKTSLGNPIAGAQYTPRERTNSYIARTNAPSPLRHAYDYATAEATSDSSHGRIYQASQSSQRKHATSRPPLYRSYSHQVKERPPASPLYNPTASFSSSSSSIYPASVHSARPSYVRSSSSGSVMTTQSEPRPVLKKSSTSNSIPKQGPQAHVSFLNPLKTVSVNMHPLLAYSRLHRAPISYDISFPPSQRSVVDRHTRTPVPSHTLGQPATEPPTVGTLIIKSEKLPWQVVVTSCQSHLPNSPGKKFYLEGSSETRNGSASENAVTNFDVLLALHSTLSIMVTRKEWDGLGHGSRTQRKVTKAYEKRCNRMGGGWDSGVRRIDYLEGKTALIGIEVDKSAGGSSCTVGKLVLGKP